jgi:hypothetical protein
VQAVDEQLYVPPRDLIEFHCAEYWNNMGFKDLEIGPARAGFPLGYELRDVMIFHATFHCHHRPRLPDDLRLLLQDHFVQA